MDHITECPKCHAQLQVRLSFASGPRSEAKSQPSSKLQELLDQINDDDLSGGAAKFVRDTRERFEKYGPTTRISEKQLAWLQRIASGETGNEW